MQDDDDDFQRKLHRRLDLQPLPTRSSSNWQRLRSYGPKSMARTTQNRRAADLQLHTPCAIAVVTRVTMLGTVLKLDRRSASTAGKMAIWRRHANTRKTRRIGEHMVNHRSSMVISAVVLWNLLTMILITGCKNNIHMTHCKLEVKFLQLCLCRHRPLLS